MKKRIGVAVSLAVLLAASTYPQTTDFFDLAKTGTPQSVQAAISQGADVNARDKDGSTPLMSAAQSNESPAVVTTLLKAGAYINTGDKNGVAALMYAAGGTGTPR